MRSDEVEGGLDRLVQRDLLLLEQPPALLVKLGEGDRRDLVALALQAIADETNEILYDGPEPGSPLWGMQLVRRLALAPPVKPEVAQEVVREYLGARWHYCFPELDELWDDPPPPRRRTHQHPGLREPIQGSARYDETRAEDPGADEEEEAPSSSRSDASTSVGADPLRQRLSEAVAAVAVDVQARGPNPGVEGRRADLWQPRVDKLEGKALTDATRYLSRRTTARHPSGPFLRSITCPATASRRTDAACARSLSPARSATSLP